MGVNFSPSGYSADDRVGQLSEKQEPSASLQKEPQIAKVAFANSFIEHVPTMAIAKEVRLKSLSRFNKNGPLAKLISRIDEQSKGNQTEPAAIENISSTSTRSGKNDEQEKTNERDKNNAHAAATRLVDSLREASKHSRLN